MSIKSFVVFGIAAFSLSTATVALADEAASTNPPPIPTLRCEMKHMTACDADGKCKSGSEIDGMKLPLKVTVDFENSVVAAVDETGYARTDHADQIVKTEQQLVLHGVDGEYGWQLMISDKSEIASLMMSTADSSLAAFGTCSNK
ncbi:hypothetical protein [Aestuariivirga sp.]|uniref:hypothetical protein n=1 Tax=Aestuariivirga sp. TaxID=2650926 RepID=UPI0039E6144C